MASKKELAWIGENEVFETNHKSKIFADLLNGKCKVWDILDYDGKTGLGVNDYYSRAKYNIETKAIEPPISDWEKLCYCECPLNPHELYIACDKCKKWFHPKCVGFKEGGIGDDTEFYCNLCVDINKQ